MIDEKKVELAVAEFTKNPYWKAKYDEAPTELSKRDTALSFYRSWFAGKISEADRKEALAESDALKHKFGLVDWQHALKYCGHNSFRTICVQKIAELSGSEF